MIKLYAGLGFTPFVFAGVPISMYETRKETLLSGWPLMVVILMWSSSWCMLVLMWMLQTTARLLHSWPLFARYRAHR